MNCDSGGRAGVRHGFMELDYGSSMAPAKRGPGGQRGCIRISPPPWRTPLRVQRVMCDPNHPRPPLLNRGAEDGGTKGGSLKGGTNLTGETGNFEKARGAGDTCEDAGGRGKERVRPTSGCPGAGLKVLPDSSNVVGGVAELARVYRQGQSKGIPDVCFVGRATVMLVHKDHALRRLLRGPFPSPGACANDGGGWPGPWRRRGTKVPRRRN